MSDRLEDSLAAVDWSAARLALDERGFAVLPGLLPAQDCVAAEGWFEGDGTDRWRSHVVMARHGYGQGEYKYFAYPLPPLVERLRRGLYPPLAEVANAWAERLGQDRRFPADLRDFTVACHAAGQRRPTPLLLRYGPGDYNRLHQDLYGDIHFPLQAVVLLNEPGQDFQGGEFVLTEQKPRSQSRAEVVPLRRGDAAVFAVNERPVRGARGWFRVTLRHGVSTLRAGRRSTLGIIFHDAR